MPFIFFKFQLASYHNCSIISMHQFTCKCHSRRHWRMWKWICSQKLMSHFFSSLRLCSCSNSVAKSVSSGCCFFFPCRNDFFLKLFSHNRSKLYDEHRWVWGMLFRNAVYWVTIFFSLETMLLICYALRWAPY